MYFSSYGPLKSTLKPVQNAKFSVNRTLRWNNSNLITDWETVLTLNNYMGEMNSESISRFQVSRFNYYMDDSKNSSSQNMQRVLNTFHESMLPDGNRVFKGLSISLIKTPLIYLMSSQKASNIENI